MTKAQDQKDERDAAQNAERERNARESAAETDRKTAARAAEPPATDAAARLRAFEDEVFGKEAVRVGGQIERGHGSPYAKMTEEQRRQYGAIENLVAAETKLADAHMALIQAEEDHKAALAATEPRPDPEADAARKAKAPNAPG
jgi:hypothetical protein